jgi:hypothetical protein
VLWLFGSSVLQLFGSPVLQFFDASGFESFNPYAFISPGVFSPETHDLSTCVFPFDMTIKDYFGYLLEAHRFSPSILLI